MWLVIRNASKRTCKGKTVFQAAFPLSEAEATYLEDGIGVASA